MTINTSRTQIFSGALAALGAYTDSTALNSDGFSVATLFVSYSAGGVTGSCDLFLKHNDGSNWFDDTCAISPVSASSGVGLSNVLRSVKHVDGNIGSTRLTFDIQGSKQVKASIKETGNTGSFGSAIVTLVLSKQ